LRTVRVERTSARTSSVSLGLLWSRSVGGAPARRPVGRRALRQVALGGGPRPDTPGGLHALRRSKEYDFTPAGHTEAPVVVAHIE
jgi:hypothetical protein